MGLLGGNKKTPSAQNTVLPKGSKPRDLLKRRDKVIAIIKAADDFYDAECRVDHSDGEKRYRKAASAYDRALKGSTKAERKAAEDAVKNAPYRQR